MAVKKVYNQDLPASCFLHVGDPEDPNTWQLPVKDASGKPDLGMMAEASAMMSGRYKGMMVDIPEDQMPMAKKKLVTLYKRMGMSNAEIPAHLQDKSERKNNEEGDEHTPQLALLTGSIANIEEGEYKGLKGLFISGIMNSLQRDYGRDRVLDTPRLRESTADYFENRPIVLLDHGLDPDIKSMIIGFTVEHDYTDEGIRVKDFLPDPTYMSAYPPEYPGRYEDIKSGKYSGFSVGGNFYRDTGLRKTGGLIFDWDLMEHSITKSPMDPGAVIDNIEEIKSLPRLTVEEGLAEIKAGRVLSAGNEQRLRNAADLIEQVLTQLDKQEDLADEASGNPSDNELQEEKKNMDPKELEALLARTQALEAQLQAIEAEKAEVKAAQEKQALEVKAREEGEKKAREIAEAEAAKQAEFKNLVEKSTQEALSRYNFPSIGAGLTVPAPAVRREAGFNVNMGAKVTMAGAVREVKSLQDDNGAELPARIIDWLDQVKAGKRQARYNYLAEDRKSVANAVQMGVPGVTVSPNGAAGGFALPAAYLQDIVPVLQAPDSIRSFVRVLPAEALVLEQPKQTAPFTRASVTAEGATKPKQEFGTDLIEIRLWTVPMIIDVTNQLLTYSRATAEEMVREGLGTSIRLGEFYYVLNGSGVGEPKGLITALKAQAVSDNSRFFKIDMGTGNKPNGLSVPTSETIFDFVARGRNVTENRFYNASALMLHPNMFWEMQTTKDTLGRYLIDPAASGNVANTVWGIPAVKTTQIPNGYGILGDWTKARLYVGQDLTLDMSSEAGDRWDRNMTGYRAEEQIGFNADQELVAFTLLDFTTAGFATS